MKPTKTMTPLRDRCLSHCATLALPGALPLVDELLSGAEKESLSHLHFLDLLLGAQADARRERAVARRIREARFADTKTLEGFDWRFNPKAFDRVQIEELATGDFIRRRNNLIMVGWSGIGKSHIIQALGQKVCVQGYRALFPISDRGTGHRRFHPAPQQPDHGRLERDRKEPHYSGLGAEGLRPRLPRSVSYVRRVTRRPDGFTCRQNSSRASALLHAPGFFDYRRIRVRPHRTDRVRAGGTPALQDHRLTQSEALHRAGDQRGLRQMGRVSGRWPAGDGAPRPPGRKSNHPQDQRQDLPYPSGQRRGQSGLREEAVSFFPLSAPTAGQSVTPHLAPSRPPNWYPFSPPPTRVRAPPRLNSVEPFEVRRVCFKRSQRRTRTARRAKGNGWGAMIPGISLR